MKPIFCIDITNDKNNESVNGAEFITRSATKQKVDDFEDKVDDFEEIIEKSKLPLWLRIIEYLCAFLSVIIFAACAKAGLETAMRNSPFLLIIASACGIIWMVLHTLSKKKEKEVLKEENAEEHAVKIEEDFKEIHSELGVPEDAVNVDILLFRYKIKDGKVSPQAAVLQTTPYINIDTKLYSTDDHVHIAELENVYSFKKSELKSITTVNKRISIPSWNKDENPRKGIYKPYKMTVNNMGDIFFKPFHILEIERDGEQFGVYFPCYELQAFESVTGLTAATEE